jgi:hypothetical protein
MDDMRAAIREAVSSGGVSRLPRLMFDATAESEQLAPQMDEMLAAVQTLASEVRRQRELLTRGAVRKAEPARDPAPRRRPAPFWLFLPDTSGYSLVPHEGEPLRRGDPIRVGASEYRVAGVGRSPMLDGGTCFYLESSV